MVELQSSGSRVMVDSVVWAQYINVTDTQTHRQPRRHSNKRPNSLRSGGKNARLKTRAVPSSGALTYRAELQCLSSLRRTEFIITSVVASIAAPYFSRSSTTLIRFFLQAMCSGVKPFCTQTTGIFITKDQGCHLGLVSDIYIACPRRYFRPNYASHINKMSQISSRYLWHGALEVDSML